MNHICWGRCGMHCFQKTDLSLDYNEASYTAGPTFIQHSGLRGHKTECQELYLEMLIFKQFTR